MHMCVSCPPPARPGLFLARCRLDLRQLQRLLAQCGYGLCVGGLGLGDLPILFKQHADRRAGGSGALTYAGLLQVCGCGLAVVVVAHGDQAGGGDRWASGRLGCA